MYYHRGPLIQQGAGLGSMFSGLLRTLMPAAKTAAKTIGKIAKNKNVRSAGKYLRKQATQAAVDTALEALEGKPVGATAKKRLKTATKTILQSIKKGNDTPYTRRASRKTQRKHVKFQPNKIKRRRLTQQEPLFDEDDYGDY